MDFGTLLHKAQKNEKNIRNQPVRYYSTKFEPPKKEQRANKQLSENIKRFLAKQEAEKKAKQLEADKKREELLALRAKDKKATRRVNVMLKRTKSANQSAIQDAVDKEHTSVTLAGPIQPDEDDYGYVSQEAAAFYDKMMEKYSKMPEEPKFSLEKKKKVNINSLNGTKDRVKAALEREKEEANLPHKRRKREHNDKVEEEECKKEEPTINKKRPAPPPPPLKFDELLKIAEKKQFEPIVIEQKPKKEEEKPLTKKQKKEMEREKEWRDRREGKLPPLEPKKPLKVDKLSSNINNFKSDSSNNNGVKPINNNGSKPLTNNNNNIDSIRVKSIGINGSKSVINGTKPAINKTSDINIKKVDKLDERGGVSPKLTSSKPLKESVKQPKDIPRKPPPDLKQKQFPPADLKPRYPIDQNKPKQFPPKDMKPKQLPPSDLKPKQFPPKDLKPKQFPPSDVRRKDIVAKKQLLQKRRIIDDEEDEYDPEMDDFIDDGPLEEEDYSKHIKEIFGYDKSKYRYVEDDDDCMESSFAQQMREEIISTKIGIMEDLEDIKKEEEEKRRKALMKKRKL